MDAVIRIINPDETELLTAAWKWHENAPDWFRESFNTEDETLEDFLRNADKPLLVGVFTDSRITAVLRFTEITPNVCNIDLFAKRDTDADVLTKACFSIKQYLFDKGIKGLYGWVVRQNRFVVNLYKKLGFHNNGIKCFRGKIKNKPCEWLYFESINFLTSDENLK